MFQRLAILTALLVARAFACTCIFPDETVREAWKDRPYVFLGTVVEAVPNTGQMFTPHIAHIRVDEAFKGVTKGQMLQLHGGGNSCSPVFRTGERSVFYMSGRDGKFYLEVCRISMGSADPEGEDLLFLHGLPATAKGTRLSGTVYTKEWASGVPGAEVNVVTPAGQILSKKTNSAGVFELYGLPPGEYKVGIAPPQGFRRGTNDDSKSQEVVLKRDVSQHVYATFEYDTQVEGRAVASGDVRLELIPVAPNPKRQWLDSAHADKDGKFEIRDVEPGTYWVRATVTAKDESSTSTFYYPSSRTRDTAGTFTIEAGRHLKKIDLALPANQSPYRSPARYDTPTATRFLTGLFASNRPVASITSLQPVPPPMAHSR